MSKNFILADITWKNEWFYFLDALLKMKILENLDLPHVEVEKSIQEIIIDPKKFQHRDGDTVPVFYNTLSKEIICNGVKIVNIQNKKLKGFDPTPCTIALNTLFNHNDIKTVEEIQYFISDCIDFVLEVWKFRENNLKHEINIAVPTKCNDLLINNLYESLKDSMVKNNIRNSALVNWDTMMKDVMVNSQKCHIIISNDKYFDESTTLLANKSNSYIIITSTQKLKYNNDWIVLTLQKFNNIYMYLMRKSVNFTNNSMFMEIKTIDSLYTQWNELILHKENEKTYLFINHEPSEGINVFVKNIISKFENSPEKTNKFRFIFILDSSAPEFDSNRQFYEKQLCKDLTINIYKNGSWSFYKNYSIQKITKEIQNKCCDDLFSIPVSTINGLKIKFLGFNHKSTVIYDGMQDEIGPLEYSGTTQDGQAIMGILSCLPSTNEVIYEDKLSWPIPTSWTLENAVTVPLAYSMAYYLLKILGNTTISTTSKKLSVLITSGMHPIGQAATSICLFEGYHVYVVVENDDQARIISKQNSSLKSSHIIVSNDNTFDIKLMKTYNGRVDFIFNFLNFDGLSTACNLIDYHAKIFDFSPKILGNYEQLGSRIFLKDSVMYTINTYTLLEEINKNKCIIRDLVINGLQQGVVKPLKTTILEVPSNTLSYKRVFNTLRNQTTQKLIIPVNDHIMRSGYVDLQADDEFYKCLPDQVYVVIGNKNEWLDLAEWLVHRGARRISIVTKKMVLSTMGCRKFNQLLSKNTSIKIETDLFSKSKEEICKWLDHLTDSNNLGGLFLVEQNSYDDIKKFSHAFESLKKKSNHTPFICIACKCENICVDLKSKGLNVLNVNWSTPNIKTNRSTLIMSLDSLLTKPNKSNSCTFSVKEERNSYQGKDQCLIDLPSSINELHLSTDLIGKEADFIEVQTKSPKYSHIKGNSAIFFIPGFKSKNTENFYSHLMYPTFEARFPENIESINHLAQSLVKKLKEITNTDVVSLIGESWGGIIALKMAQILESKGNIVSVSLLQGDPHSVIEWTKEVINNYEQENQLKIDTSTANDLNNSQTQECLSINDRTPKDMRNIAIILPMLRAILNCEPLSHKILARIQVFVHEITNNVITVLNDYTISLPILYETKKSNSKEDFCLDEVFRKINDNVAFFYGGGDQLSLQEKYDKLYFEFNAFKPVA